MVAKGIRHDLVTPRTVYEESGEMAPKTTVERRQQHEVRPQKSLGFPAGCRSLPSCSFRVRTAKHRSAVCDNNTRSQRHLVWTPSTSDADIGPSILNSESPRHTLHEFRLCAHQLMVGEKHKPRLGQHRKAWLGPNLSLAVSPAIRHLCPSAAVVSECEWSYCSLRQTSLWNHES